MLMSINEFFDYIKNILLYPDEIEIVTFENIKLYYYKKKNIVYFKYTVGSYYHTLSYSKTHIKDILISDYGISNYIVTSSLEKFIKDSFNTSKLNVIVLYD